jgi:hypothetical protein
MPPIASAALRSAIMAIAVYLLFVGASVVIMDAPIEYRLRAVQRSFTDIPSLTAAVIGWLGLTAFHFLPASGPSGNQLIRIAQAVFATLAVSAAIVGLYQGVWAAFHGGFVPWQISPRYQLRLFEAAIFAVTVVRISLPILPRFARMPPRNP